MNDRTCIVTRAQHEPADMIRFVVGPDGAVVPDLKRKLPGRGCWVVADRTHVDTAVRRKLFARVMKRELEVPDDLGSRIDALLSGSALGALGLARKAGKLALGAAKVEASVRNGSAGAVLHAFEASEDGVRKITQARRATVYAGGPSIVAYKLFSESEMGLALGATNVIHAAVLAGDAGNAALKRLLALDRYRGEASSDRVVAVDEDGTAAEDTE